MWVFIPARAYCTGTRPASGRRTAVLKPLLGAIAAEAPYLAEGANDKFQSRVAHAVQSEPDEGDKPAQRRREPKAEVKQEPPMPEGTLASKLRRWLGS